MLNERPTLFTICLATVICLWGCANTIDKPDRKTPDAAPWPETVDAGITTADYGEIRRFTDVVPDLFVYGQYQWRGLGEVYIYIFPNGHFVAEEFFDIAPPAVVASGRWLLKGDDLSLYDVALSKNDWVMFGKEWLASANRTHWAWKLFTTRKTDHLSESVLIPSVAVSPKQKIVHDYLYRVECFRDWKSTYDELEKSALNRVIEDSF